MAIATAAVKTRRARTRATVRPYCIVTRARDGRTRSEECADANAFKSRLLASAAENDVVSFDDIVDLLERD